MKFVLQRFLVLVTAVLVLVSLGELIIIIRLRRALERLQPGPDDIVGNFTEWSEWQHRLEGAYEYARHSDDSGLCFLHLSSVPSWVSGWNESHVIVGTRAVFHPGKDCYARITNSSGVRCLDGPCQGGLLD